MSLFGSSTPAPTVASGITIQSSIYGSVVPVIYGQTRMTGNLIWYGDFQSIAGSSSGGGKGGGGGGKDGGSGTKYKASFMFALAEGTLSAVLNTWTSKAEASFGSSGLSFAGGALDQSPWGHLTTYYPSQALAYAGTAYVYAAAFDLGSSAQLPNFSYEVQGLFSGAISGLPDADPKDVVTDVLTNARYGVGFPSARLGDLSVFSGYCRATGMVISPLFDTQQDAASLLNAIVQDCNSEFVWSGTQLTIVSYGDVNLSANGATYTAPSAALYSLTDDDFLDVGSGDPVQCSRARPSDRMNSVKLEYLNRSNQYNVEVVEAKDLAAIQVYGLRTAQPKQSHYFCDLNACTMSATLQLQRQAVRNVYTFTVGWRFCLLDPMDIIEISDSALGLAQQWVRVTDMEEDDNGNIKITAEEVLGGTGGAPLYAFQSGSPFIANYNSAPGSVNQPVIFEPPPALTSGVPQVWVGASGGSNWGGADVWLSLDNATYAKMGRLTGPSRQGVLTANLASGSDPDTAHTLAVDLSESRGALMSGAMADADAYRTLCYADGELIAYETATLTGTNAYSLTYLRRGAYGSAIGAHSAGALFCRLDDAVLKVDLPVSPVSYIGQTLYLKFTSFNIYGGGQEALADVDPYTYAPTGVGAMVGAPSGVTVTSGYAQQADGTIQPYLTIAWTAAADSLVDSYEVEISPHGAGTWHGVTVGAATLAYTIQPIAAGTAFDARVRSVRAMGGPFFSTWVEVDNTATVGKAAASADPSGLTATGGFQHIRLGWIAATESDIAGYDVAQASDSSFPDAAIIARVQTNSFTTGALGNGVPLWFWVRSVNTSGHAGNWVGPASATTLLVNTGGITANAVTFPVGVTIAYDAGSPLWSHTADATGFLIFSASLFISDDSAEGGGATPFVYPTFELDIAGASVLSAALPFLAYATPVTAGQSIVLRYSGGASYTLQGGSISAMIVQR